MEKNLTESSEDNIVLAETVEYSIQVIASRQWLRNMLRTIRKRLVELSADSTRHGYRNIFKTDLAVVRLMWIVLFISSISFFWYLMSGAVEKFLKYQVATTIRLEYVDYLDFPTVSICNSKPFMSRSAFDYTIQQFAKNYQEYMNMSSVVNVLYGNYTDPNEIYVFRSEAQNALYLLQNQIADVSFNETLRQTFGYSADQFFQHLSFGSLLNDLSIADYLVTYYDALYGNCFKFNTGIMQNGSSIQAFQQTEAGPGYGMVSINFVDVFPNQSYNFMNLLNSYTFGIKVSIDDNDTFPIYYNNMMSFRPGACTYVGLKKTMSTRQPYPYSSCQDLTNYQSVLYDKFVKLNKTYSQRVCYELCKQKKMIDTCGCAVINYPNVDNYHSCTTFTEQNCYMNQTINTSGCDQYCPLECQSSYYDYTIYSDYLPDQIYYDVLKATPGVQALFNNSNVLPENVTYDTLSNSLACLFVYFEDMQTTEIEETVAMTWVDLLGSIGGSLGLCLGMSILSFCENTEILIEVGRILVQGFVARRNAAKVSSATVKPAEA